MRSMARTAGVVTAALLVACGADSDEMGGGENVVPTETPALEPNDVSILFTLPASPSEVPSYLYLLPDNSIFPAGLEDELPSLFSTAPGTPSQLYQAMQVTALRFVPCPPAGAMACKPQVRLAAQLVSPTEGGGYAGDEVALHLFYDLDAGEPEALAAELLALKQASPVSTTNKPLFVHPALVAEGMTGAWGEKLRTLIRTYARKEKLVRVTSMGFIFDAWPFRDTKIENGHVVENTVLSHMETPDVSQSWDIFGDDENLGNLSSPSTVETGPAFFASRANFLDANRQPLDNAAVRDAIVSVERTLNPRVHTGDSVDCASCHITRFTKARAIADGVTFTASTSYPVPSWANVTRLQDPAIETSTANIVQFGYFLRQSPNQGLPDPSQPLPSVGERVIHESIEAAIHASALLER